MAAKLALIDNPSQVVINSKKEVVKKKDKCTAKRKEQLAKLCGSSLSPCHKSSPLSLPCFVPVFLPTFVPAPIFALVPAFMPTFVLAPIFCLKSPAVLLSYCLLTLAASKDFSSPCHILVFCCGIPALRLQLSIVYGLPLLFISSPLKPFKQSLSDEPQTHISISPAKPLCLFPAFSVYNLDNNNGFYNPNNNNKCK